MRTGLATLSLFALAACSQEPAAETENADDFASRIGQPGAAAVLDPAQPDPDAPNVAVAAAPAGSSLTDLQRLGDIGGVNLGPREGGCTFMVGSEEMLIAAAMRERTLPGKAVVRLGDTLVMVDSGPGGLDKIKSGTTFTGEGFTVQVSPAAGDEQSRAANVLVSDAAGNSQNYSGNWICA